MKRSLLIICIALFLCCAVSCSYVSDVLGGIVSGSGDNNQTGNSDNQVNIPGNDDSQNSDNSDGETPEEEKPEWPEDVKVGNSATGNVADVLDEKNALASGVDLVSDDGLISASLPEGALLEAGTTKLTFSVNELEESAADITLGENENSISVDVHIEGLSPDNETVIRVYIKELLPIGLNMGNYSLYHVENGETVLMTLLADGEPVHNNFEYDPVTGDTTMYLKSFSEIALVSDTENAWKGKYNYDWYNANATDLVIANADQLAAFSAIVGGMLGQTQDSFSGKTVKLIADINLGDDEANNKPDLIFYPIGYWNSDETYEKTNTAITSGFYTFEGTFDGNGNTIANFYQNTWEMKGDHNWYDATLQYYRDGMGLFGKVYGGTVKNLTVENFSSDGEITTTGVIAAYADGATFENIAIFNCNPRVYNIGNGGIVGCVGWYAKEADLKTTFTNITVDNSNKISALWGSYDVACGGIVGQYYPTSGQTSAGSPKNAGIEMVNCHVAAQMDVYNDVCANYQYYAYRYTGMLIGSVRENETVDGHSYPKMDGITAKNCTVHFGTWNDYYYCEIIDNTTASYTHDYQMSRLVEIKAIDGTTITYLDGTTGTVPATGRANYVIVDYTKGHGTANATCYHFKDGEVWNHEDAGYHDGEDGGQIIDENGDGNPDLREDKQHIYLEFNNLVTGYGWGVTSKGVGDLDNVTILDREEGNSVPKFEVIKNELTNQREYKLGDIFNHINGVPVINDALTVTITYYDANGEIVQSNAVSANIVYNTDNWADGTISFTGTGLITITIQDYYFCTPTELTVDITERQPEVKFDVVMNNGDFLHRVGNSGTVALDKLFAAKNGVTVGTLSVTVEAVDGTGASGTYSNNAIQFNGTGVVKVTITDNNWCIPTELYLEVVDAVNATSATNATSNNVVLLNNAGFGSLEISGGYTLYGNGFTLTCSSDSYAKDRTYAFVTLNNGTLDNVKIVVPNFSHSVMYEKNKTENGNPSNTDSSGTTRYYNIRSAVIVTADSNITNSYISGGRAAIYLTSGELEIVNSTIFGGAVANIQTETSGHLILEDVTLIQKPIAANVNDTSKTVMGFSVVMMCDTTGIGSPVTLKGYLHQYAWAHEGYTQYVPSDGQSAVTNVLSKTDFIHEITYSDGVTRDSVNLGFAYMPNGTTATKADNMEDKRSDSEKAKYPYTTTTVNNVATIYTYENSNGTDSAVQTETTYTSTTQGIVIPNVQYSDVNANRVFTTTYDALESSWKSTLKVDVDAGVYTFSFDKLLVQKFGKNLSYIVKTADGTVVDKSVAITLSSAISNVYYLTITDDQIYDKNGDLTGETVEITYIFELLSTKTSLPAPTWTSTTLNGTPYIVCDTKNSDWNCAVPVLDGLKVKYWSKKQNKEVELDLNTVVSAAGLSAGLQNGSNNTITITVADEYTLTITTTGFKTNDNGKPVVVTVNGTNKLYFTVSSSSNYVSTSTTSRAPNISYSFTDANNSETLELDTSFEVVYATYKSTQYKYSSFCNGTLSTASSCITPDTLVTLANGSQKEIQHVTYEDQLLVWNFYTGEYDVVGSSIVMNHGYDNHTIVALKFSDGTVVKTINGHGFFDTSVNKYVILDETNVADYISHEFVKIDGDGYSTVVLVDYEVYKEYTESWSILTERHYNCILEGMWTLTPAEVKGSPEYLMPFVVNDDMKYDETAMQVDIDKYGLYTYEDFAEYISEERFAALSLGNWKVSVGKGYITWEDILYLISIHTNN